MCSADKSLTISDLCDDLLCQIFDRLPIKQVVAMQSINKDYQRCVKLWLQTVDELAIEGSTYGNSFYLRKSLGNSTDPYCGSSLWSLREKPLFASVAKMLDTFTCIRIVSFNFDSPITAQQMIVLVSRCAHITTITLSLGKIYFTNDDWCRLMQCINQCDIHLRVRRLTGLNVKQLIMTQKQFNIATRIKSVVFWLPSDLLKIIDLLDHSTRIEFIGVYITEHCNEQLSEMFSRRVFSLQVSGTNLEALAVRRFLKLSSLRISLNLKQLGLFAASTFEFPQLKSLTIRYGNKKLLTNFFAAVKRLDQLQQIRFYTCYFTDDDRRLTAMLKKLSNITKLHFEWYSCLFEIQSITKLFKLLPQTATCLRTVDIDLPVHNLTVEVFGQLIDSWIELASRMNEIKLKLTFSNGQTELKEKTKTMPKNVQIVWV